MRSTVDAPVVNLEPELEYERNEVRRVRQTFVVPLQNGLHARPCALLVKTLQAFAAKVEVEANGEKASGHSIMGLMALAAAYGTEITFTITGKDAVQAMTALRHVFATGFEKAYRC